MPKKSFGKKLVKAAGTASKVGASFVGAAAGGLVAGPAGAVAGAALPFVAPELIHHPGRVGQSLENVGGAVAGIGALTGQPEIVAAGGAISGSGYILEEIGNKGRDIQEVASGLGLSGGQKKKKEQRGMETGLQNQEDHPDKQDHIGQLTTDITKQNEINNQDGQSTLDEMAQVNEDTNVPEDAIQRAIDGVASALAPSQAEQENLSKALDALDILAQRVEQGTRIATSAQDFGQKVSELPPGDVLDYLISNFKSFNRLTRAEKDAVLKGVGV